MPGNLSDSARDAGGPKVRGPLPAQTRPQFAAEHGQVRRATRGKWIVSA